MKNNDETKKMIVRLFQMDYTLSNSNSKAIFGYVEPTPSVLIEDGQIFQLDSKLFGYQKLLERLYEIKPLGENIKVLPWFYVNKEELNMISDRLNTNSMCKEMVFQTYPRYECNGAQLAQVKLNLYIKKGSSEDENYYFDMAQIIYAFSEEELFLLNDTLKGLQSM